MTGIQKDERENLVTATRKLIGEQAYERLFAEGAVLSLQEAAANALDEITEDEFTLQSTTRMVFQITNDSIGCDWERQIRWSTTWFYGKINSSSTTSLSTPG